MAPPDDNLQPDINEEEVGAKPAPGNEPVIAVAPSPDELAAGMPPPPDAPKATRAALFCAAVGGVSPILVNLARHYDTSTVRSGVTDFFTLLMTADLPHVASAIIAPLVPPVAAALAAIFLAWIFQEINHYRAFLSGMSAPALFVSLVANGTAGDTTNKTNVETSENAGARAIVVVSTFLVPQAFAQDEGAGASGDGTERVLRFDLKGINGDCGDCTITFNGADGNQLQSHRLADQPKSGDDIVATEVPQGAETAVIGGVKATNNAEFKVDQAIKAMERVSNSGSAGSDNSVIKLQRESNWLYGFSLGTGAIDAKPYDLELKAVPRM